MGWRDDPVMNPSTMQPAWMADPLSEEVAHPKPPAPSSRITARDVGKAVAPAVYPTIGAVLGSPLGPGGQIVGGLGGVAINQILGITEPSAIEPAAQVLVPGGAKGINAYRRLFPAFGTEARAAETLHKLATPEIRGFLKTFYPAKSSRQLFKEAESSGTVPMPSAQEAAKRELENIKLSLPEFRKSYGPLEKQLKGVMRSVEEGGVEGGVPATQFQRLLHDVGKHTQAADSVTRGGYKDLYKGLMQDLEQAPKLADARQTFKREMVINEIKQTTKPFTVAGGGDVEKFRANKLLNRLNDPEDLLTKSFKSAFTPDEQRMVLEKLTLLNKLPPVQPPSGAHHGFGKVSKTAGAILAGGAAGLAGHPILGATIAGVPYTARLARDFSTAWQMEEGRALIKNLLQDSGGKFTPEVWSAIQAFSASQFAQPTRQPDPRLHDITIQKSMPDAIRAANAGIDARAR